MFSPRDFISNSPPNFQIIFKVLNMGSGLTEFACTISHTKQQIVSSSSSCSSHTTIPPLHSSSVKDSLFHKSSRESTIWDQQSHKGELGPYLESHDRTSPSRGKGETCAFLLYNELSDSFVFFFSIINNFSSNY